MANIGVGAGLAGFAEGFAKAFTRGRELEHEQKAKSENFVTEQLIKGALNDPKAVVESPELMADITKRLGPGGDTFVQFLQHHAKRVDDDSAEAFLTAPAPGQAPSAQPAASPASQMIAGQGTVLAPPAGQPAFEAPQFGGEATAPEAQMIAPGAAPQAAPVGGAPVFTDAQGQSWDAQGNPVEAGAAPAAGEAAPTAPVTIAPPKSRAQQLQEKLRPGVEYSRKFPGGRTVKLTGTEAQATKGYQYFYEERGQGLDDVTAAENAQKRIVAEGGVPPKFIDDMASSRTKTAIAVNRANAIEAGKRDVAVKKPQTAEQFRAAAAQGMVQGQVHGRRLTDTDLATVQSLNAAGNDYVFQTLPDGTYVSQPRDAALANGRPVINPSTFAANMAANKMRNKSGSQEVNARVVKASIEDILTSGALDLLEPARPGEAGISARVRAETKGRYRVWDLAQKGDKRAVSLQNFQSLATSIGRAMGQSANMSDADRRRFETLSSGIANGNVARQRGEADLIWLSGIIDQLTSEGLLGEDGTGTTDRRQTEKTNSTTTTTLPYGARIIKKEGKTFVEYPD